MSSYKCPFCGVHMNICQETTRIYNLSFEKMYYEETVEPHLQICFLRCPNDDCGKETIFASGVNGYINNSTILINPAVNYQKFPDYIPDAIRKDYWESCAVLSRSPKAAATLARRCLQGMIRDFWGIREKTLYAEITKLQGMIPSGQWQAIDALRRIGNIGAHMEHDVNLIVDVDQDEAQKLVTLIEHLLEKWYVDRHETEQLYASLISIDQEKQDERKRIPQNP